MRAERRTLTSTLTLLVATAGAGLTLAAAGPAGAAPGDCLGLPATIVATQSGQTVNGTPGPDVILAQGYDDLTVLAGAGDDRVCSSNGRSARLFGGEGDDRFDDLAGQDYFGRTAPNVIDGGPGSDDVVGTQLTAISYDDATAGVTIDTAAGRVIDRADTDTFIVQQHDDEIIFYGSRFADRYVGSFRADTFYSSLTDRHLGEGDGIRTGDGDDEVVAAPGSTVHLGPGNDTAAGNGSVIHGEAGNDRIGLDHGGTAFGGPGNDRLGSRTDPATYTPSRQPPATRLVGGSGSDTLSVPFVTGAQKTGCGDADLICAGGTLVGGTGADTLSIPVGGGTVDLASGRAWAKGGRVSVGYFERVVGSRAADVILGDGYDNLLYGSPGRDVLRGRGGADRLVGGADRDRAYGGAGRDRCQAEVRRSC
jgi:Ca2+-binding RTX toxin-like protein